MTEDIRAKFAGLIARMLSNKLTEEDKLYMKALLEDEVEIEVQAVSLIGDV